MKDSARYAKIVEWSEEDNCYVGSCPGLIFGAVTAITRNSFLRNFAKSLMKR